MRSSFEISQWIVCNKIVIVTLFFKAMTSWHIPASKTVGHNFPSLVCLSLFSFQGAIFVFRFTLYNAEIHLVTSNYLPQSVFWSVLIKHARFTDSCNQSFQSLLCCSWHLIICHNQSFGLCLLSTHVALTAAIGFFGLWSSDPDPSADFFAVFTKYKTFKPCGLN